MEGLSGQVPMESMLPEKTTLFLGRLPIGADQKGRVKSRLETEEQLAHYGELLTQHEHPVVTHNTADCMDDRLTLRLADGTANPATLRRRVVYQWPGGPGLALAKAGVAADAAFVKDARNFQQAFEISHDLLSGLRDKNGKSYQDGGHAVCGASKLVEQSVATPPPREILLPTLGQIIAINEGRERTFDQIQENKRRRLEAGFYGSWSSSWHEDFLAQKVPHNFSHLATQPDEVHGHYGNGLFVIIKEDHGFAKNEFIEETGELAFAATLPFAFELARQAGGTEEERQRLIIAFVDDLLIVSDDLLAPDFPAFSDEA